VLASPTRLRRLSGRAIYALFPALAAATAPLVAGSANAQDLAATAAGSINLPVEDPRERVSARLDPRLTLTVVKESGASGPSGWSVEVNEAGRPSNLLYHSRRWHGPYPSQVYAWSEAEHIWPAKRTLAVRGRPWRVTISCEGCVTRGEGAGAVFVQGAIQVRWERTHP